jgi:hypothetical protein
VRRATRAVWAKRPRSSRAGCGGWDSSARLGGLLSNRFSIPGSEAEKGFAILRDRFGQQGQGYTLVVVKKEGVSKATVARATQFAADRSAKAVCPE